MDTDDNGFPQANFSCIVPHFQNFLELKKPALDLMDTETAQAYGRLLTNYLYVTRGYVHKFVDVNGTVAKHGEGT